MTAKSPQSQEYFLLVNPQFLLLLACAQSRRVGTSALAEAEQSENVEFDLQEIEEEEAEGGATAGATPTFFQLDTGQIILLSLPLD